MNENKNISMRNHRRIVELKNDLEEFLSEGNKVMAKKTLDEICKLYEEATGKSIMENEIIKKAKEMFEAEVNESSVDINNENNKTEENENFSIDPTEYVDDLGDLELE